MENSVKSIRLIVREYNNKPKILYYDSESETHIAVKPYKGYYQTPICLPRETVFKFDENLIILLNTAFEKGNFGELKGGVGKSYSVGANRDQKIETGRRGYRTH